jgi:hypothetical protein
MLYVTRWPSLYSQIVYHSTEVQTCHSGSETRLRSVYKMTFLQGGQHSGSQDSVHSGSHYYGLHKKLSCKGTMRQVFICLRPRTQYPPPLTHCICVNLFTKGRGGGER